MSSRRGFEDQVHAVITVAPDGAIEVDPPEIRVKRNAYVSWECADADEWEVDFGAKSGAAPFGRAAGARIGGGRGERVGHATDDAAHEGGEPDDPASPDGPRGRYSYAIRVRVNGREHERDPDLVVGPPRK
ncbi:MAG: hypothetical protein ACOCVZ_03265 [Gemmatimonadota bacterium]